MSFEDLSFFLNFKSGCFIGFKLNLSAVALGNKGIYVALATILYVLLVQPWTTLLNYGNACEDDVTPYRVLVA